MNHTDQASGLLTNASRWRAEIATCKRPPDAPLGSSAGLFVMKMAQRQLDTRAFLAWLLADMIAVLELFGEGDLAARLRTVGEGAPSLLHQTLLDAARANTTAWPDVLRQAAVHAAMAFFCVANVATNPDPEAAKRWGSMSYAMLEASLYRIGKMLP